MCIIYILNHVYSCVLYILLFMCIIYYYIILTPNAILTSSSSSCFDSERMPNLSSTRIEYQLCPYVYNFQKFKDKIF